MNLPLKKTRCTFHPDIEASHVCVTCEDAFFCASCEVRYHGVYSVNAEHVRYVLASVPKYPLPCQLCSADGLLLHCLDCFGSDGSRGLHMCVGCLMHFHNHPAGLRHRILPESAPAEFELSYAAWRKKAEDRLTEGSTDGSPNVLENGLPKEVYTIVYKYLRIDDLDRVANTSRYHRHICLYVLKEIIKRLWRRVMVIEKPGTKDDGDWAQRMLDETEIYTVGKGLVRQTLHSKDYSKLRSDFGQWARLCFLDRSPWKQHIRFYARNTTELAKLLDPYILMNPFESDYWRPKTERIRQFLCESSDRGLWTPIRNKNVKTTLAERLLYICISDSNAYDIVKLLVGKGAYRRPFDAEDFPVIQNPLVASFFLDLDIPLPIKERLLCPLGEPCSILEMYARQCEGADLKRVGPKGNTLLHTAVRAKSLPFVKYLLSVGLDSEARNDEGKTPLDLATGKRIMALLKSSVRSPVESA